MSPTKDAKPVIYSIGHSTRTIEQFVKLLQAHGIEQLVDVRTIPKSRHNPQFESTALAASLEENGIAYHHLKALGGLRQPRKDSPNTGWKNAGFRGYADYMQTDEFWQALQQLEELARLRRTAFMCAEALYWRCHRSLLSDALTYKKWQVLHIQSRKTAAPHKKTPFLRIRRGVLVYPEAKEKEIIQ